jgi:hypothetical protein
MLRGRFLGIAKNVGDVFCFLVLTNPDDTNKPQQVIARMVVRRRYPRENPPVVEKTRSKKLNFYKSDGVTPLEEPFANDETLPITDIIAEEQLENAPETIEDPNDSSVDLLDDAIAEVYGPSRKRQRTEDMIAEETVEQAEVVSGSSKTVEMEQPTVQSTTSTPENDQSPATESNLLESVPIIVDTVMTPTTGNQDGDDQSGGGNSSSTASPVPATQDNSDNIEITDEVAQHIEDRYSDDLECELFDSICGHGWDNGVLMLRIKWKTDEESVMAFTMVKRDYPYETAEYILQNKVGTSEHKYATGHYTRWARAYMRQCKQTLRRIIRVSGGDIVREDDVTDSPIIPTDSSPNGNLLFI